MTSVRDSCLCMQMLRCARRLSVFMKLLCLNVVVVKSLQVFSFLLDESVTGAGICFDFNGTCKDARMQGFKDAHPFLCSPVLSFAFPFIITDYGPKLVQFRCAK